MEVQVVQYGDPAGAGHIEKYSVALRVEVEPWAVWIVEDNVCFEGFLARFFVYGEQGRLRVNGCECWLPKWVSARSWDSPNREDSNGECIFENGDAQLGRKTRKTGESRDWSRERLHSLMGLAQIAPSLAEGPVGC